jgi:ribosomal protein L37AE/L43A
MKKNYVRVCPECHSTDVSPDMSAESYAKGLLNQWKCNTCGHTGLFFPEYPEEDIQKMKKEK